MNEWEWKRGCAGCGSAGLGPEPWGLSSQSKGSRVGSYFAVWHPKPAAAVEMGTLPCSMILGSFHSFLTCSFFLLVSCSFFPLLCVSFHRGVTSCWWLFLNSSALQTYTRASRISSWLLESHPFWSASLSVNKCLLNNCFVLGRGLSIRDMMVKKSTRAVIIYIAGFLHEFTMHDRYHVNVISNLPTNFQFSGWHVRSLEVVIPSWERVISWTNWQINTLCRSMRDVRS